LISISVPASSPAFENLEVSVLGSEVSRVAVDAVAAERMDFNLGLGNFEATKLPSKLYLRANRGSITLQPTTVVGKPEVYVDTDHAGLVATSAGPLELEFASGASAACVVAAQSIEGTIQNGSSALTLAPAESSDDVGPIHISFASKSHAPGYFVSAAEGSAPIKVSSGALQTQPNFLQDSQAELQHLSGWIKQVSSTSAPWIARVWVQGPGSQVGSWQVLSTEAFLALPVEWFILFSVGMLCPVTEDIVVQLLGVPHQWPPTRANGDKEDVQEAEDRQWAIFESLRPYLDVENSGGTIAWVPLDGVPVIFTKSGAGRWRSKERDIFRQESFMFICAVLLNFSAAVVSAFIILNFLNKRQLMNNILRDQSISVASSQRRGNERIGTSQRFRVMASLEQSPEHGVLLRWRKRTGEELSPYLWIYAKSQPARGTVADHAATDEVYIERLPLEQVPTMNDNGVICEFLFPVALASKVRPYEKVGDGLKYQHVYRFQVLGYEQDCETLLGSSEWSNKVYISPPVSVFDSPFRFIKAFFPVPTSSLDYFMDKYAQRNIQGKVPQHLVVLSNIKVTYHKNFKDYAEYRPGDTFFLVAYVGQSRGTCEQQTHTGRCETYDKTSAFDPEQFVELDDNGDEFDEQHRTQPLPASQQLRLGSIDRKDNYLVLSLRLRNALDAAEGKVDFDDLMEAFEEIDKHDTVQQTIEVDLVVEDQDEFNEDYLARVTATVTFTNSIDKLAVEKRPEDRFFQLDAPGQIYYEGEERMVSWDPQSSKLAGTNNYEPRMNIFLVYPDLPRLDRVLIGRNVPKENGVGWTFMVQFPRDARAVKNKNAVSCFLEVDLVDQLGESETVAQSHRFLVCRTWMLKDAELMYASFCKMNNMSMKSFNATSLEQLGLTTASVQLKLLPGLRSSMQFERDVIVNDDVEVIQCADMLKIGNATVEAGDHHSFYTRESVEGGDAETGSQLSSSSPGKRRVMASASDQGGATTGSTGASTKLVPAGSGEKKIFRPTSRKVEVLQHVWPKPYPRRWFSISYGTDWSPCFLLVHSFYPVDNIMAAAKTLVSHLKVWTTTQQEEPPVLRVGGSDAANLAELILLGGLPFAVEAFMFLVQFLVFIAFPLLVLLAALVLEYYMTAFQDSLVYITSVGSESSFLPDLVFRSSVSGITAAEWLSNLPPSSAAAFVSFTFFILVIIALIFESNFLRNAWPLSLQNFMHQVMNTMGDFIIFVQVLCTLVFACTLVLWFLMTVVLYPEQMITVIACVAGITFVLYTMIMQYQITRQNIHRYLQQEVPEILDLVCDNFLEDYDKKMAAQHKIRDRRRNQAEQCARRLIETFLLERFRAKPYGKTFQKLREKPSTHLTLGHRIWDRALLKEEHWDLLLAHEERKALKAGVDPELLGAAPKQVKSASLEIAGPQQKAKSTTKILADFGFAQEETAEISHFDLKVRLLDRENEAGGECIHQYSKELRVKLMHIFVRLLEEMPLPSDIFDLVNDPDRLGEAIYRAHEAKLRVMNPLKVTSSGARAPSKPTGPEAVEETTLLELLIQDVNNQKMKPKIIYETLVAHLDEALHPETLSDSITPFVEQRLSDEIETQLRLTVDEQSVGRAMQRLFENLRIWKGRFAEGDQASEEMLLKSLTLLPQAGDGSRGGGLTHGLMGTLETLQIISKDSSKEFRVWLYRSLERRVRAWSKDDAEGEHQLVIDSADLEDFVRELLSNFLWWGAIEEILAYVGFPMGDGQDEVPKKEVMTEFERMCLRDGFMPREHVLEFFRAITKADEGDGPAGRIWKSKMVVLMKDAGVCGYVHRDTESPRSTRSPQSRGDLIATISAPAAELGWPDWMNEEWRKVAPALEVKSSKEGSLHRRGDDANRPRPFLPKAKIQQFFKLVLFSETLHVGRGAEGGDDATAASSLLDGELEVISKEYDNWFKHKDAENPQVWTKRGKLLLKLRGVWAECFYAVLDKLENKVDERKGSGEILFESAMAQWRQKASDAGIEVYEGLLDIGFFKKWLKLTLVNNRDCSLPVFKDVLKRAQISLPDLVAEALWYAGKGGDLHASLRNARDLEDRLVMYLSKGLCYESVRSLVFDELQTSSLQTITENELRVIFTQMDQKTGRCGFAEPHEVHELICLMSQHGMTCTRLIQAFKRLKMTFEDKSIKSAFMLMDTNADDDIDLPEFLGLIDHLIVSVIPQAIFSYLNLEPWQVLARLTLASATLCIVFLFIFISLSAFQVKLSGNNTDAGAGASLIRAGLALVAALGLRREANNDEEREGLYTIARERLYYLTGVTQSQVEARRRYGSTLLQGGVNGGGKKVKLRMPARKRGRRGAGRSEEDDEGGDEDHDDGDED